MHSFCAYEFCVSVLWMFDKLPDNRSDTMHTLVSHCVEHKLTILQKRALPRSLCITLPAEKRGNFLAKERNSLRNVNSTVFKTVILAMLLFLTTEIVYKMSGIMQAIFANLPYMNECVNWNFVFHKWRRWCFAVEEMVLDTNSIHTSFHTNSSVICELKHCLWLFALIPPFIVCARYLIKHKFSIYTSIHSRAIWFGIIVHHLRAICTGVYRKPDRKDWGKNLFRTWNPKHCVDS